MIQPIRLEVMLKYLSQYRYGHFGQFVSSMILSVHVLSIWNGLYDVEAYEISSYCEAFFTSPPLVNLRLKLYIELDLMNLIS